MSGLEPSTTQSLTADNLDKQALSSVRSILLVQERARIAQLEIEKVDLQQQINDLQSTIQELNTSHRSQLASLQENLDYLNQQLYINESLVIPRVEDALDQVISRRNRGTPDDMAEALGPIIADSTRVQIRESRKDMIDALYPIIGQIVQEALSNFARELQRNIDAQLATFRKYSIQEGVRRRLAGVSDSEVTMRQALPFAMREIFLIQRGSGLLMAYSGSTEAIDSDLISGMLTAIRDFAHDSFGQGQLQEELSEIQYGEQRIVIQDGMEAYLAVVFTGTEPEGFRAALRNFITDLHLHYDKVLSDYDGDPQSVAHLVPLLNALSLKLQGIEVSSDETRPLTRTQKLILFLAGLLGIFFVAFSCFYLMFTIRLLPIAFPGILSTEVMISSSATPTATAVSTTAPIILIPPTTTNTSTPLPTNTNSPTSTLTPTPSPTMTSTPTFTFTPSPEPTATNTTFPTATPEFSAITIAPVWTFAAPTFLSERGRAIPANTPLTVTAVDGNWLAVEWRENQEQYEGWLISRWVEITGSVPLAIITPGP